MFDYVCMQYLKKNAIVYAKIFKGHMIIQTHDK